VVVEEQASGNSDNRQMDALSIQAFSDELRKIAVSIPGLAVPKMPTAGLALGNLRNGGIRPPSVPKIGVTTPKV